MAADETANDSDTAARSVRIGCAGLPSGVARHAYFEHLDLLEVNDTVLATARPVALKRWRSEAPDTAGFTMMGRPEMFVPGAPPPQPAGFHVTLEPAELWKHELEQAQALAAEVMLFSTPPAFTPTEPNKDRMRRFFTETATGRGDLALAWEPHGVWEPAQAQALADELGLIYALDPLQLEDPPPDSPNAYFRVHGLGIYRNKIADDMLELLADMVDGYERAWVVFANIEKYRDAERFHRLMGSRAFVEDEE